MVSVAWLQEYSIVAQGIKYNLKGLIGSPFCVSFWNFRVRAEQFVLLIYLLFYLLFPCCSYLIYWQVFHFYHLIMILRIYIIASTKIASHFRISNYLENQSQVDHTLFQGHISWDSLICLLKLILSFVWLILWILLLFVWTILYQYLVLF